LDDACDKIEEWRRDNNEFRPHSSLDSPTPSEFAWSQITAAAQKPEISIFAWISF